MPLAESMSGTFLVVAVVARSAVEEKLSGLALCVDVLVRIVRLSGIIGVLM
ncbi:hypothetical protein [Nocardioides sp.]|uniref:hypothetical protein n=1 Tax=Nocardioides sp. TaxID=35761 RepID=UPI002B26CB1D|nr:hypothetical protein [Nocardioides sp.]